MLKIVVFLILTIVVVKDLHNIILLFTGIFVIGVTVTIISINRTLDQSKPSETVEVSVDSTQYLPKNKKTV